MTLVNTFEEPFGDIYHHGVWKQLSRGVSEKIHHSVVTLASFKGDFALFCLFLFQTCTWSSCAIVQNYVVQEMKDSLHAPELSLTGMVNFNIMDVRLF